VKLPAKSLEKRRILATRKTTKVVRKKILPKKLQDL
jgi:hypothetical protein